MPLSDPSSHPLKVIVATSDRGPVNSPFTVPAWHLKLVLPSVSRTLASAVPVNPGFGPGPGSHSNLPVFSPSLLVVHVPVAYLCVASPGSFTHRPISGSSSVAVATVLTAKTATRQTTK